MVTQLDLHPIFEINTRLILQRSCADYLLDPEIVVRFLPSNFDR